MTQYIYFEILHQDKVLDGGMLRVNRYDPANPEDGKAIVGYISEYVVPFVADADSVEKGEIQIRYREMSESEYNDMLKENERIMRGQLPYG